MFIALLFSQAHQTCFYSAGETLFITFFLFSQGETEGDGTRGALEKIGQTHDRQAEQE